MPKSYDVLFASSNTHKYEEAEKILAEFDIELGFVQTELVEIQDDSLSKIALQKAENAYEKCKKKIQDPTTEIKFSIVADEHSFTICIQDFL